MPYRYSPEFRRRVLDRVAAGRSVASVAVDLGVSDQTIYTWRKQELIDTGARFESLLRCAVSIKQGVTASHTLAVC